LVSALDGREEEREKDEQVVAPNVHPPFMHLRRRGRSRGAVLVECEDCSSRKNGSQRKGERRRKRRERTDLGVSGNAVALALTAMEEMPREGRTFPRLRGAEKSTAVLFESRVVWRKGSATTKASTAMEEEGNDAHQLPSNSPEAPAPSGRRF
jgi:hypothetical protein